MSSPIIPAAFLEIFRSVYEEGDQVLAISSAPETASALGPGVQTGTPEAWAAQELPANQDAVFFLDLMSRQTAAGAGSLAPRLGQLVRPGGLLFLNACTVDHADWNQPEDGWQKSGSRELHHSATGEYRFFLYDDEIVVLFAAWNILHHHESSDGVVEMVLVKPGGRTVDVATVLYGG